MHNHLNSSDHDTCDNGYHSVVVRRSNHYTQRYCIRDSKINCSRYVDQTGSCYDCESGFMLFKVNYQKQCHEYSYLWYFVVVFVVVIAIVILIVWCSCRASGRCRRRNHRQNRTNDYVRHTNQQVFSRNNNQINNSQPTRDWRQFEDHSQTNMHTPPNPVTMQQQNNPIPQAYPYNQQQQYNQNSEIVEINANQPGLIPHRNDPNTQQQQPQYPANQNSNYPQQQYLNTQFRWSGRFWQDGQVDEMRFDSMVMDQNGNIQGNGCDAVGGFNLSGHCSPNGYTEINKQYHGAHTVHYRGQMDNNGWIKGDWEIPGNCGGTFELHVDNQAGPVY